MASRSRRTGLAEFLSETRRPSDVSITVQDRCQRASKLTAAALFNSDIWDIYLEYSR